MFFSPILECYVYMCPQEVSFKNVIVSTCSNGNGVIDAVDHNGFLRIKVPREHPKGSVIDIFCLWKDGKYILGYWEILDLYFEAENLVEAVKIFCDLIDQFDYYQVIDVFCGEDRPQEMVN